MRILSSAALLSMIAFAGTSPFVSRAAQDQTQADPQDTRPGPPGTFRVRVRLIPVDVIVTDRADRPILDLTREDFQIFENGRPREIRNFVVQTLTGETPSAGRPPAAIAAPAQAVTRQARTFLFMMGRGHHQTPMKALDTLIRFVREDLLPQDRVAVFAYNRATDFTTDHERIAGVLERYKKSNDKIESWLETRFRGLATVYGLKEIPNGFQGEIDKIFDTPGQMASRQVPPGRMTEKGTIVRDWDRAAELLLKDTDRTVEAEVRTDVAEEVAEEGGPGSQVMLSLITFDTLKAEFATLGLGFDQFAPKAAGSFQDLQNLYTSIEYMRYMEGEKHLIYFSSEGLLFPNGNTMYEKGVIAIANDARVSIEAFHTGGLFADPEIVPTKGVTITAPPRGTPPPPPGPPELSQANWSHGFMLSSFSEVSRSTGGRAVIGEDIAKGLNRLNELTRHVYLLGYSPGDDPMDGEYRRIEVKVNRPGARVYSRQGYYARDSLRPYDREEFLAYSRISAAGAFENNIEDIPFQATVARAAGGSDNSQIQVDLLIDPAKVGFRMVDNRHVGRFYIAIFFGNNRGDYIGEHWKTMNMNLPEENYQQMLRSGIAFSALVSPKAPSRLIKVVVYDTWSDKVGSKLIRLK